MRLIDADELKRQLRGRYHPYSDELYKVESVIDRVPSVAFPQRLEWSDDSTEYHQGYVAGWNMYLATVEGLIVQAKEAGQ